MSSLAFVGRSEAGDEDPAGAGRTCEELAAHALDAGIRTVQLVAWRDLDDPEAGGSELHLHRIASRWAEAGLDVVLRTSAVAGHTHSAMRSGYLVNRRNGRYGVFAGTAYEGLRSTTPADALVEVWNGMPFFSPLWFRGPRVVFLHHVHAEMWGMVLPRWMAAVGRAVETRLAPRLYRSSTVVTLSDSSREEIVEMLGMPPGKVKVVPPGVDPTFTPGGERSPVPLVVAVGRLVPVKRYELLVRALERAREDIPELRAVIVGEGYERDRLESLRRDLRAEQWLSFPGRLSDDELLSWYRRAWLVASTSLREGWGMTLTEAAACGTPGVATRIAGHEDAVVDGVTGLLCDDEQLTGALTRVLCDEVLRSRLGHAAREHARRLTWDSTAAATLAALVAEAGPRARVRARRRTSAPRA